MKKVIFILYQPQSTFCIALCQTKIKRPVIELSISNFAIIAIIAVILSLIV